MARPNGSIEDSTWRSSEPDMTIPNELGSRTWTSPNLFVGPTPMNAPTYTGAGTGLQKSTWTSVPGTILDARYASVVQYTVKNVGTGAISWRVRGYNDPAASDAQIVNAAAAIAAGAVDKYGIATPPYAFYDIQFTSSVSNGKRQGVVWGIAKGS